jgi:hypothetical protein
MRKFLSKAALQKSAAFDFPPIDDRETALSERILQILSKSTFSRRDQYLFSFSTVGTHVAHIG